MNMTSKTGGVAQTCFYQSIARCLGHVSLSEVTLISYIDRLGSFVHDTSAVIFGEEEGSVGGVADIGARVERAYGGFERGRVVEKVLRVEGRPPLLAPSIARAVAADPAVVDSSLHIAVTVGDLKRGELTERLVGRGGVLVPPVLGGPWGKDDVEELELQTACLKARLNAAAIRHVNIRAKVIRRVMLDSDMGRQTEATDHLILNSFPDLLSKAVNILKDHHLRSAESGMHCIHIFFNISHNPSFSHRLI